MAVKTRKRVRKVAGQSRNAEPGAAAVLLVDELAQTAAIATERHRVQTRLAASEAKFAAAFGQAPIGITITSLETGKLVEVNDAVLGINGYTREEVIGRSPDELGLWIDPKQRQERFARLAAGENVPPLEARFRNKNGEEAIATISSALVEIEGKPHVLSAVADITERKRIEQTLRKSEQNSRFLVELNAATAPLIDANEIMAVTARLLGQYLDADRCMYAAVVHDEDTFDVIGDYTRGVKSMVGRWRMAAFGEVMHGLLRAGKNWVLADAASDARVDAAGLASFRAAEIGSGVVVPLHKSGRLAAGLAVQTQEPRSWSDDEVALIEQVAHRCWESIERARAQRELAESESRHRFLLELNNATQALADPDEIMAAASRMLGERLVANRCAYCEFEADGDHLTIRTDYISGLSSLVGRWRASDFGRDIHTAVQEGRTLTLEDTEHDERVRENREAYRQTGIRAFVAVVLVKQSRLRALMFVHSKTPRRWTPDEVALIELAASRCWESTERARAQRRVVDSEARARLALDIAQQGTWSWEPATDTFKGDARLREMLGLPREGPVDFAAAMGRAHPDDAELAERTVREALAGKDDGNYSVETRICHPDGSTRWLLSRGQAQFSGEGAARRPRLLLGSALDITERKTQEEAMRASDARNRFLVELNTATQARSDPEEIMAATARLLGERLRADRCFYTEFDADQEHFTIRSEHLRGLPSMAGRYRIADFGDLGGDFRAGRPARIDDAEQDPRVVAESWRRAGIGAGAGVPVMKQGRLVAMLVVHDKARRAWTGGELELMAQVANRCWDAIERARAQRALAESETRARFALDVSAQGTFAFYPAEGRLEADARCREISGLAPEGPLEIGAAMTHAHPEDRDVVAQAMAAALDPAGKGGFRMEVRYVHADGSERWALLSARALFSGSDSLRRPDSLQGTVLDITERKRAEAALREAAARKSFLLELNTATQALSEPERIMEVATRLLGQHLNADRCIYYQMESDQESGTIAAGYSREGLPDISGPSPLSLWGEEIKRALLSGEDFVTRDAEADPRLMPAVRQVYRQAQIAAVLSVPLHKDGRLVAVAGLHQAQPRNWSEDEIALMKEVAQRCWDTLERARVQGALAESETRVRVALDVSGQGIWSIDLAAGVLTADVRYRETIGLKPRGPITLEQAFAQVHPGDEPSVRNALSTALASDDGFISTEFRVLSADGSERWVASSGQVVFEGANRKAARVYGTVLDITHRKHTEQALREADRRKDEFLATLAHELRNPLAPILNSLHVLRLSKGDDPLHEMMERQVKNMVRLVDDLMEVSRISRGKIELKKERLDLHGLIESVLQAVRPQIDAARHTLSVTPPSGKSAGGQAPEPFLVDADAVRLSQVLTNLINNSIKYTPPGGKIWLTALREEEWLVLSVRDNGAGIPKEMLSRVFEMFTQVDRTLAQAQGGLGIGLSLARTLVELHGGRISARSDGPDMGSEFIVRLPLAAERRLSPGEPATAPATAIPLKRILVVDDNRDAADSLAVLLKFLGAEAQVAHDGPSALKLLDSFSPAVILLDLGMPGMDGFEVAREVRKRVNGGVTLIALTGWGQDEDRARTRNAGFDHHLTKPPDISALQAVLASLDAPAKVQANPKGLSLRSG